MPAGGRPVGYHRGENLKGMIFTATARWDFRGETWFSIELEAVDLEVAGAMFYAMLPTTFFRGNKRLVSIRPRNLNAFDVKMLAHKPDSQPE